MYLGRTVILISSTKFKTNKKRSDNSITLKLKADKVTFGFKDLDQ